ncbi:hypothetical protein NP493_865g01015 [Ridgeia piscesae]|uniref:Coiled-coil domain-containing protein 112 n=1 Tax=Ridgeia piscesae TaxID=27915 RepID=A0AAD9KMS9_RIDPI|nr:hypothetical protein NP493_865g01015 [Ridgeia piscesae]
MYQSTAHARGNCAQRRDPATAQHGDFCLLRFRPGPVRPSLDNLVTSGSPNETILMPGLARTPDRHRTTPGRTPDLKPSTNLRLQVSACSGQAKDKDKHKMQQLVQDMSNLKIKIQSLEKDLGPLIFLRKSVAGYSYPELREYDVNLAVLRKAEEARIRQNLKKVKLMVSNFTKTVSERCFPSSQIVVRLKDLMEDIETNITEMKANQAESYKDMIGEEKSLCAEITALQKRIESWKMQNYSHHHVIPPTKVPAPLVEEETDQHDLPPEINSFETFMHQTGGATGGWDDTDHSTFVRIQNTHKGHPSMKNFLTGLPTKTEEEIHRHIGWFLEYKSLLAKKKEAIQKWRQKKDYEKKILARDAMKQLAVEEEEKAKAKRLTHLKDEIHNTKMAIHRWKLEKDLAKAEEEQRKLAERQEALAEEEKKRKEQREYMEAYRQQRKQLELKMEEETKRKDQMELITLKMSEAERKEMIRQNKARFQERDEALMKKKIEQVRAKEREKEEREARLLKLIGDHESVNVPRDASRLLKPTKGWMERQKAKATEGADGGGPMLQMPHK